MSGFLPFELFYPLALGQGSRKACDRNQEVKMLVPQQEPEWKQAYFKDRGGQTHAVLFLILPVWCLFQK